MRVPRGFTRGASISAALLASAAGQPIERGGWADFGDQGHCTASVDVWTLRHGPQTDRPEEWVNGHNHYRKCHGSPPVVWNQQLADYAKAWVEKLLQHCENMEDMWAWVEAAGPGVHRPHDGDCYFQSPKNAENIWSGTGVTARGGYSFEAGAVTSWYQEVTNDCPTRGHSPGCGGGILNHYTAMVWRDVREIGCYIATLDTSSGPFSVASCRYSPGAEQDDFESCSLPNMNGCDGQQVPALVEGECPRLEGSDVAPAAPGGFEWQPQADEQGQPPADSGFTVQVQGGFPSLGDMHFPLGDQLLSGLQRLKAQLRWPDVGAPAAEDGVPAAGGAYAGSGGAWPKETQTVASGGEYGSSGGFEAQPQAQTLRITFRGLQLPSDFHSLTGLSSSGLRVTSGSTMAYALPLLALCLVAAVAAAAFRGHLCCAPSSSARPAGDGLLYIGVPGESGALPGPRGPKGGVEPRRH